MKIAIIALTFFFGGFVASTSFMPIYGMYFKPEQELKCLPDHGLCVGEKIFEAKFGHYSADKFGGLTMIVCQHEESNISIRDTLYIPDFIAGEKCQAAIAALEFRSVSGRTLVLVRNGVIDKITRGSLHNIDF